MKHVKLFEQFSGMENNPQLLVTGDWKGITKDGAPEDFIAPATFIFKYLPSGSPDTSGYDVEPNGDLETISEEAFGGDQNGVNVAPKDFLYNKGDNSQYSQDLRQGVLRIFVDPSLAPEEIESYLRSEADRVWSEASDEEYYMVSDYSFEDKDRFEPSYLRLAAEDKPFPRKVIFTIER